MMQHMGEGWHAFGWRRLTAAIACIAAVAVWASGLNGSAAASEGDTGVPDSGESDLDSLLTEDAPAVVSEEPVPHRITFDSDGNLSLLVEIEAIMPEGVVVDGHEIDISGYVANTDASPILEANPQWYIELEPTPRVGMDVQLEGASVIEYSKTIWGANPKLVDPVRVVEQGKRETILLPDGGELEGCNYVRRSTVGKQIATSFVEIAYDPDTCKRIVEFGVLSVSPTPRSDRSHSDGSGQAPSNSPTGPVRSNPSDESRPSGGNAPGDSDVSDGFRLEVPDFRSWTQSQVLELAYPVLPATSEVNTEVEVWNQQPQYAPSKWRWWTHWLRASGWRRDSHDAWSGWTSNNIYVGEASDYSNNLFARTVCTRWDPSAHGTTYAGHTVQTIGYANLTADNYVGNYKRGACSYLLRTAEDDEFVWINAT